MSALSIQGTTSSAGKSLLTTALCRLFARRGVAVAPFKAQNMSNNARVVDGGEIGVAQYLQALAAGVTPDVTMNPVLVKPEADTHSQVVVLGRVDEAITALPWRERGPELWPVALEALRGLLERYEVVLIEGAGSPAEINLPQSDLANMRTAQFASAPVVLVSDIDRGGSFAHLYGTWALVSEADRALIRGFVLNKFRGDPGLLPPGPERLEELTGVPMLGVVPMLRHGVPDEDGVSAAPPSPGALPVAVVCYPRASNLDEFRLLESAADVRYVTRPEQLDGAQLLVLPGSKHVAADLAWLEQTGWAAAVRRHAASGAPLLGICGGLMMLGDALEDPAGVDGSGAALGLLPVRTVFHREKRIARVVERFGPIEGPWAALSGVAVEGYEIRHGAVRASDDGCSVMPGSLAFARGGVLGVTMHGLFERPEIAELVVGRRPPRSLEDELDLLADLVEPHLPVDRLLALAREGA